jgi:hypothetical protein
MNFWRELLMLVLLALTPILYTLSQESEYANYFDRYDFPTKRPFTKLIDDLVPDKLLLRKSIQKTLTNENGKYLSDEEVFGLPATLKPWEKHWFEEAKYAKECVKPPPDGFELDDPNVKVCAGAGFNPHSISTINDKIRFHLWATDWKQGGKVVTLILAIFILYLLVAVYRAKWTKFFHDLWMSLITYRKEISAIIFVIVGISALVDAFTSRIIAPIEAGFGAGFIMMAGFIIGKIYKPSIDKQNKDR